MLWVGRDLTDHLVPNTLCHGQQHLRLDQVAQRPFNQALDTAREGAATTSLGHLFQFLITLRAEFLTYV